ncbi:hypothetical protein VH1709_contig00029-0177 [Vibrio harveyi]|nr:hypothetical protein VH1709_contig00029-0177 [Vibrio harveyi]
MVYKELYELKKGWAMNWFKKGLKRYDDWCKEMGLTPDQKRSCVPYKQDPANEPSSTKKEEQEKPSNETI